MRTYNEWKENINTSEPSLDLLSAEVIRRLKARNNPVPGMTKAKWLRRYQAIDVKRLLLLLDRNLLPILTTKSLTEILEYGAPFPDPNKSTYPRVYVGGFIVHSDGGKRNLNKGELLRISNILSKPATMNRVLSIYNQVANKGTAASAKLLGCALKKTLQREGLWVDLEEVEDTETGVEEEVNNH
jgi:hypothetical protein